MTQACYTKEMAIELATKEMDMCLEHLRTGAYIMASWNRGAAMVYEDMLIDVFDFYLYDEDKDYAEMVDSYTKWGFQ